MLYNKLLLAALALSSGLVEAALARRDREGGQGQQQNAQQGAVQSTAGQQGQPSATPTTQGNVNNNSITTNAAQATGGTNNAAGSGAGQEAEALNPDALQTGSEHNGQGNGVSGVKSGQAPANT